MTAKAQSSRRRDPKGGGSGGGGSSTDISGSTAETVSVKNNMSQYMRSKLSKSRMQVIENQSSSDYNSATLPLTPQTRKFANTSISRSLLDDASPFNSSGEASAISSGRRRREEDDIGVRELPEETVDYTGSGSSGTGVIGSGSGSGGVTFLSSNELNSGEFSSTQQIPKSESAVTAASSASTNLDLPLPYTRLPQVTASYGREQEMQVLHNRFEEGAGLTCITGAGGIGKSHLVTHACKQWLGFLPFNRFVIWINAATEWTLRVSYLEALQQVLMGNIKQGKCAPGTDDDLERGEIIIVAELLHRQLSRQRRKEEAKEAMRERKRRATKLRNGPEDDDRDDSEEQETTEVFSQDSEDWVEDDISVETPAEGNASERMDTSTLAQLLWDALLQGVSPDYEWIVVVQNVPGGMGGVQGPDGLFPFFFPTAKTPEEDWRRGRIVFTSRHQCYSGVTSLGPIFTLRLERLREDAAVRMLIASTVFDGTRKEGRQNLASPKKEEIHREAERIAEKIVGPHYLDGSPLMIVTAVGQIITSKMTLRQYYGQLKQQVAEALEASGYGTGKVQTSVKRDTAMSVCLEQGMDNAHAQGLDDILSAAAFVCGEGIPLQLLGGDTVRVQKLCEMNLLSLVGKDTYSMHRVHQRTAVDAIITDIDDSSDQSSATRDREEFLCTPEHAVLALRSLMSGFAPESPSTWRLVRSCMPHVEALRIHHDLLERKNQLPSNFNHAYYAEIVHSSATALQWAMKDTKAAFAGFKEALRLQRRLLRFVPSSDIISASSSSNLKADLASGVAKTLTSLGGLAKEPEEAQQYLKEALQILRQTFGENSKSIELMTLHIALADVEIKLQHTAEAYDLYKKGLELYFTIFGHNQNVYAEDQKQFLASILQKIGNLSHSQMKRHTEAELYLEGAVSLLRHLRDVETKARRDDLANALESLGSVCHAQGKVKDARQHYKNALKIKDKIHGEVNNKYGTFSKDSSFGDASGGSSMSRDDSSNGSSCSDSESLEHTVIQTEVPSCDEVADYALEIVPVDSDTRERVSKQRDVKLAKTLHRLGVMAWNLGSLKQAEDYFEKALSMQYSGFGLDAKNEDIAITLFSLGGLSNDLHNNQERACCYYKKALQCYHESHGKDAKNESIAQLLHALGQSLQLLKRPQEAKWHLKQALDMKFEIYDADTNNPEVVATQLDLGKVSRDLDANRDAMFYFKAALKGLYGVHGRDAKNVQLASCLTQLGGLSYCSGVYDDAQKYFEKSLDMKLYLYGPDEYNDDIASTLNNLGSLMAKMKKFKEAFRYYEQALQQYNKIDEESDVVVDEEAIKNHKARTLHNLGLLSANLKKFDDARKYYSDSLKIKSEVFKDVKDSPDLALTLSKLSSVEAREGKEEAARYYQNQAIKRSPTFLETHKALINKDLLPATPEEAAELMAESPDEDVTGNQEMLRAMEFWQAELEKSESHKTCWYNPFKRQKEKNTAKKALVKNMKKISVFGRK